MKHTMDFFRNAINDHGQLEKDERSLLFMLPIIQVAWAHGAISPREAFAIFEIAREDGIDPTHWFNEKIDSFLMYQPSSKFYEDALDLIRSTIADMTVKERKETVAKLISRSERVAAAAGDRSPMDVDHRVSEEEKKVIDLLYEAFGLSEKASVR